MTDMVVMSQFGFKLALVVHIASALCLFAALLTESISIFWLRRAASMEQARMALTVLRRLPLLYGPSGILVILSGLYLGYLDWSNHEAIGWIIVALVAFVLASLIGAAAGRWLADKIMPQLGHSSISDIRRTVNESLTSFWPGIGLFIIIGILAVMIFQPSTVISVIIIVVALVLGFLASSQQSGVLEARQPKHK